MKTTLAALAAIIFTAQAAHGSPSKGTLTMSEVVPPRTGVMYSDLALRAGETTAFDASGVGGKLECSVLNSKNVVVLKSCHARIKPEKAEKFTLIVTNVGKEPSKITVIVQ